ncbi:MAG: DUF4190 domain-containing protein [Bifidobacteriaceae bacterium]|nr:DUF4190 domain-containing protein [Bifidobacteriaceae bacterium]
MSDQTPPWDPNPPSGQPPQYPAPGGQAPGYPPGPAAYAQPIPYAPAQPYAPPAPAGTNTLAIVALITGIVGVSLVAIVLGFVARSQISKTGQAGNGMALAGIILGFVYFVITIIIYVAFFVLASQI